MKKTLASLMLAGSVLGGLVAPASSVFASVVDNGDGTQTVQGQQDAQVEFKGQIGEIDPGTTDPTDPDAPGPGTDWIKVTLPTKVVYYSTSASAHKTIESGDYKVTNHSVYPVSVNVTGFVGEDGKSEPNIDKIGNLDLVSNQPSLKPQGPISLVKDSVAQKPNAKIAQLGADKTLSNYQDTTNLEASQTFAISGTTAPDAKLDEHTTLNNKLDITLVGLDKDGHDPATKA